MKYIYAIFTFLILVSCKVDTDYYYEKLKNNINNYDDLIHEIEIEFGDEFKKRNSRNRLIFFRDQEDANKLEDVVINSSKIIEKMKILNVKQINFEKTIDSCLQNFHFSEIYLKIDKNDLDETVYFLYEYCGTKSKFESSTILYKPINDKWSIYIESY